MELFKEESEDNVDGKKKEEHNHFGLSVGTIVVIISLITVLIIDIVDKIFCRLWQLKALHLFVYPSVIASKFVSVCLNCIRSLIFYSTFIRAHELSLICKQNAFFIFHLIAFFAFLCGQPPSRVEDNCKTCTRKMWKRIWERWKWKRTWERWMWNRAARIVAALQPGCEEMKREWGNEEEMERKWGNGERLTLYISSFSLYFLPLSPFPNSLSISSLSFHFLHQNASHFVAKC